MGNLLYRRTGVICADVNDGTSRFTLCDPEGEVMSDWYINVGNAKVTCEDCRVLITAAEVEARAGRTLDEADEGDGDMVKALAELLNVLGLDDENDESKDDDTLSSLIGDMVTHRCFSGTCDHAKVRLEHVDLSTPGSPVGDATPAVELSDEMLLVATTLMKATLGWTQGAMEKNDEIFSIATSTVRTLITLIAEDVYSDKAAQERFIATATPNAFSMLLLGGLRVRG